MPFITLSKNKEIDRNDTIKTMIFIEGTVLGPRNIFARYHHASYIPIGDCVNKIQKWQLQGAEIVYCTFGKTEKQACKTAVLLQKYRFAGTRLYYREANGEYKDIVEIAAPDVLIEDDCRSIGGERQMCITYVEPTLKAKIQSIVVREFTGIDCLPAKIDDVLSFK